MILIDYIVIRKMRRDFLAMLGDYLDVCFFKARHKNEKVTFLSKPVAL